LLLQYFLDSKHQDWAFINRGQLADLIGNVAVTFTFHQKVLNYDNMIVYESNPTFTTYCYDDVHKIVYAPIFYYEDANLFGINVSSNFQASGFYATSDPSTAAYLANILMVS
jgi:hypothetical protein